MEIKLWRGSSSIGTIDIGPETTIQQKFFGLSLINARVESTTVIDFQIRDYLRYKGLRWYINSLPDVNKTSTRHYQYNINFDSEYYDMNKVQYLSADNFTEFNFMGDVDDFVDIMVTNLNRVYGINAWQKGTIDLSDTTVRLLRFKANNCRQVIQQICIDYTCEFYFTRDGGRRTINVTDEVGVDTGDSYSYGQGSGLRDIKRLSASKFNMVTRLYGFGSKRNLKTGYRDNSPRLKFSDDSFLENNVATYELIEDTKIFEDIYPHRTGTVTSVDGSDSSIFFDSGTDFDVFSSTYRILGVMPKVIFQTGNLAGYQFDVVNYDHGTKQFTIEPFEDEIGTTFPSGVIIPAVDDTFIIIDINLPASYITTAETALEAATQAYLDDNSVPRVSYTMTPDWRYMKTNDRQFTLGDSITIVDTDLGINTLVRIVELEQQLVSKYKYKIKVQNFIESDFQRVVYSEQSVVAKKGVISDTGNIQGARRVVSSNTWTSRTIQTAESGQRIVLSSVDNTLRFHSATEDDVIVLDDNITSSLPGMILSSSGGAYLSVNDSDDPDFVAVKLFAGNVQVFAKVDGPLLDLVSDAQSGANANGIISVIESGPNQDKLLTGGTGFPFNIIIYKDGSIETQKTLTTVEGGRAIKLTNRSGSTVTKGQLVEADHSNDDSFTLIAADDDDCIGVVYDASIANNAEGWIVTGGKAEVAMEDNTAATHGNWVRTSTTEAGYADSTNAEPPGGGLINLLIHFTEIGHCLESVSATGGGTHILALCSLHFN